MICGVRCQEHVAYAHFGGLMFLFRMLCLSIFLVLGKKRPVLFPLVGVMYGLSQVFRGR